MRQIRFDSAMLIDIEVQYFAAFREQAGCSSENISTSAKTPAALYSELASRHGFLDSTARCKVAINDELQNWETALNTGDTVLFFPPVAGG